MDRRSFLPRDLPPTLASLGTLALDLRWTWSHGADHLWRALDAEAWELRRNPWLLLQEVAPERLAALAADTGFLRDLHDVEVAREAYLAAAEASRGSVPLSRPVAYFSLEYALGEAIPLYAGGLGVLAGDHLKTASDLGVPMVAVGLLYQEGYFRQVLDGAGRQAEHYPYNDPIGLPIQPVLAADGTWLTLGVDFPGRTLHLRVWCATVGRVPLYLLDANVFGNDWSDRCVTGKLYAGGAELRLRQEMVLGIGGYRLLETLGVKPGACHLNEGHAAFVVLERARFAMREHGLSFPEALRVTRAGNVFTTHTSLPAGFDQFSTELLGRYFPQHGPYMSELGLSLDQLLALGRAPDATRDEPFRPAFLAARGSGAINGVSATHVDPSREAFKALFPRIPRLDLPVGHITNGVHVPSWDSAFADELWTRACGADRWRTEIEGHEAAIAAVSDDVLWTCRARARAALVGNVRRRLDRQTSRQGAPTAIVDNARRALDPDVLTIGFARRFTSYKRPNLLLSDVTRLSRLLGDARRPVQLVIAGKAHPGDGEGKALVEAWTRFVTSPDAHGRCVFLEDYDLGLAQELVQGVDVWINTPRKPLEACGTSGMKVLVNGGLNLSVRDGWWAEAYEPGVGWAIGDGASRGAADDAATLFDLLEREVIPTFYDRDAGGVPRRWLAMVHASMARLTPRFSANRMMREYVTRAYAPAERALDARLADGGALGRVLQGWSRRLEAAWPGIRFGRLANQTSGDERTFTVEVFLKDIALADVAVELYADPVDDRAAPERLPMRMTGALPGTTCGYLFSTTAPARRAPGCYTPRVVPAASTALLPLELPLVAWRS